jgi:hypothetical protein
MAVPAPKKWVGSWASSHQPVVAVVNKANKTASAIAANPASEMPVGSATARHQCRLFDPSQIIGFKN